MDKDGKLAVIEMADQLENRPKIRADCLAGGFNERRPCGYYGCKWHLGLDVDPENGSIQFRSLYSMDHTCALDMAERHGLTLDEVADLMSLTRERIRQIEAAKLPLLRQPMIDAGLAPDDWDKWSKTVRAATQDRITAKQFIQRVMADPVLLWCVMFVARVAPKRT